MTPKALRELLTNAVPAGTKLTHGTMRWVSNEDQLLSVRRNVLEPGYIASDDGYMITVIYKGGLGYASGTDISPSGVRRAVEKAIKWAETTAGQSVIDFSNVRLPAPVGKYSSNSTLPWHSISNRDKINQLQSLCSTLKISDEIVDWSTSVHSRLIKTISVTLDGGEVSQNFDLLDPKITVRANSGSETQTRTLGGNSFARQGGWEVLEEIGFFTNARQIAEEARQLLHAPNCPTGPLDALISADQMILQIHESIGHPLELDRILGDERNYAGQSFVSLDMVGKYQYGSLLLNVTHDPSEHGELAGFAFDDEGTAAKKEHLIKDGVLVRLLGGTISQQRSGAEGVATSRATNWNRPAIDRMSNLNIECGSSSLNDMISQTERGIHLKANSSWSIDDSRNKFQFSCEWGQLIENGQLTKVVKNPSYRGISATFWRDLIAVGNKETQMIMGTPMCGKGEPNQVIHVGHATPTCLFKNIDVFGGDQ